MSTHARHLRHRVATCSELDYLRYDSAHLALSHFISKCFHRGDNRMDVVKMGIGAGWRNPAMRSKITIELSESGCCQHFRVRADSTDLSCALSSPSTASVSIEYTLNPLFIQSIVGAVSRQSPQSMAPKTMSARRFAEHGQHIFIYNHTNTDQVIYSLTRVMNVRPYSIFMALPALIHNRTMQLLANSPG